MKWLKRRLQKWLEIDTTCGKPGFEAIYYKGKPVQRDESPLVANFEDEEFRKYVNGLPAIDVDGKTHNLNMDSIKKGYDKS